MSDLRDNSTEFRQEEFAVFDNTYSKIAVFGVFFAYLIAACIIDFQRALPLFITVVVVTTLYLLKLVYDQYHNEIKEKIMLLESKTAESRKGFCKRMLQIMFGILMSIFLILDVAQDLQRLVSAFGIVVLVLLSYLLSIDRNAVKWRPVIWGLGLQFMLGILILRTKAGYMAFKFLGDQVSKFLNYSDEGSKFVFGSAFDRTNFAFKILPTIIYFSSFISVLYYLGVMQALISSIAKIMVITMGTSGSESLNAAANIFIGQTEAPLMIKPYVESMTNSELHAVMTGGFATIAGGVLSAFVSFGVPAEHLIAASVMSAPAALAISKLLYPEKEESVTKGEILVQVERTDTNFLEAAASGASSGISLVANVAANLIAFLALLALVDAVLHELGSLIDLPQLSFDWILSYLFMPIAWLLGVPWEDCSNVGLLLGKKLVINEFVAYAKLIEIREHLSDRAFLISTYALCGFSNFSSIGIQIGGISAMAPTRRSDLARLALRSLYAGTTACFLTSCIAGMLM